MTLGKLIVGLCVLTVLFVGLGLACSVISGVGWFASRTADVVQQEVDPAVLLAKYSWLKETHARLDSMNANIKVKDKQLQEIKHMPNLDRTDRENLMVLEQELTGIIAAYNDLASRYNAKMVEVNWRFTNVGQLPAGASEPLPREYAPYKEQ